MKKPIEKNKQALKHISFFANKKEVIEIEKLKLFHLMMGKKNDVKTIVLEAIRERNKKLIEGANVAENQTNMFR